MPSSQTSVGASTIPLPQTLMFTVVVAVKEVCARARGAKPAMLKKNIPMTGKSDERRGMSSINNEAEGAEAPKPSGAYGLRGRPIRTNSAKAAKSHRDREECPK